MRLGRAVRIVGLVRVREHAVDERGVHRPEREVEPITVAAPPASARAKRERRAARRQLGAGDHRGQRIEQ